MHDIRDLLRRHQAGDAMRKIARETGLHRKTIGGYLGFAKQQGWLAAESLPEEAVIQAALAASSVVIEKPVSPVEPFRARVEALRGQGLEVTALHQRLKEEGFTGSYHTLRRYVRRIEAKTPQGFMRVETPAGEEAQVDFGFVGEIWDPRQKKRRKAWVFVMVLSYSRHTFAHAVFDQSVETWLDCHVRAFEFFGGAPERLVIDNLKAAITKACFKEPEVQRSYGLLAEHYGVLIAPCKPRTPEHKGKVESGVRYVSRNALAGFEARDINHLNEHLERWCLEVAGVRDHGTTHEKPLERFKAEKLALQSLPPGHYAPSWFKVAKLHGDCHVVFESAYYSAPHRFIGQQMLLKVNLARVELYYAHELVATHPRASHAGQRRTNDLHYAPEKLRGALQNRVWVKDQAEAMGPSTAEVVVTLLDSRPVDRLRSAQGVLGLAKRYGVPRLEAACKRALAFGQPKYHEVANILKKNMEAESLPAELIFQGRVPERAAFARPAHEIAAHLNRRAEWN